MYSHPSTILPATIYQYILMEERVSRYEICASSYVCAYV